MVQWVTDIVANTVANLPASPTDGTRWYVTDATSVTFSANVVGGGTNHVPVWYDSHISKWRIG